MNQEETARFNDSLSRCGAASGFFEAFRDFFLQSSPDVARVFSRTDPEKQLRVLRASVFMLMMASTGDENTSHLSRLKPILGALGLNIRPQLYDLWLDALLTAVREHDSRVTGDTELVWRRAMANGIAFMKAMSSESGTDRTAARG